MTIEPKTIRPGSTLVFKGRAEERHSRGWMVSFPGHLAQAYFEDEAVRHAEHIPAPKTFKRGDWVRQARGNGNGRYGIVTKVRSGSAALGALVTVNWHDGTTYDYYSDDLDPDEAPE